LLIFSKGNKADLSKQFGTSFLNIEKS